MVPHLGLVQSPARTAQSNQKVKFGLGLFGSSQSWILEPTWNFGMGLGLRKPNPTWVPTHLESYYCISISLADSICSVLDMKYVHIFQILYPLERKLNPEIWVQRLDPSNPAIA